MPNGSDHFFINQKYYCMSFRTSLNFYRDFLNYSYSTKQMCSFSFPKILIYKFPKKLFLALFHYFNLQLWVFYSNKKCINFCSIYFRMKF
jgi:hypothetical protein